MQDFIGSLNRRQLLAGGAAVAAAALAGHLPVSAQTVHPPVAVTPTPLPPAFVPGAVSVTTGGVTRTRTFVVHIPPVPANQTLPAIIAYHGGGQDGLAIADHWRSVMNYAVIVCPNALPNPGSTPPGLTEWQYVRPNGGPVPQLDLDFTEEILNWLRRLGFVDMTRVYANGFSSGGNFTWQMSMLNRSVNWFAGYAPMSAIPNYGMIGMADPAAISVPKPLAFTMGTADENWSRQPVLGGVPVQQPVPTDAVMTWITRNRTQDPAPPVLYSCGRGSGATLEPRVDPFGVEQFYPPAAINSAAIVFMTVVNGSHCWPLTGSDPTGRGLVTHDVDWAKRLINFWTQFAGMNVSSPPNWRMC